MSNIVSPRDISRIIDKYKMLKAEIHFFLKFNHLRKMFASSWEVLSFFITVVIFLEASSHTLLSHGLMVSFPSVLFLFHIICSLKCLGDAFTPFSTVSPYDSRHAELWSLSRPPPQTFPSWFTIGRWKKSHCLYLTAFYQPELTNILNMSESCFLALKWSVHVGVSVFKKFLGLFIYLF